MFWTFSSLTTTPEFTSMVAKFKSVGASGNTEEVTTLRLKLSELEVTWKYRFEQLNNKLLELEDLYLNDLAVHKREVATLKSRQVEMSGNFASQIDLEGLTKRVDQLMEQATQPATRLEDRNPQDKKKGKKERGREGA